MGAAPTKATGGFAPDAMLTSNAQADVTAASPDVEMDSTNDPDQPIHETHDSAIATLPNQIENSNGSSNKKRRLQLPASSDGLNNAKKIRLHIDDPVGSRTTMDKTVDGVKRLSKQIWHHIFTFVPPRNLGRLLAVNKLFHHCLNPSSSTVVNPSHLFRPTPRTVLPILTPDAIWRASRRLCWPRMPAPLKGKSELDMWRLACSLKCQFCSSVGEVPLSATATADQWHRGPGAKGVSPIFPFAVVCCGECLTSKSAKEIDVLVSSMVPSVLLPALPAIFITDQLHVVSSQAMQTGTLPQLTKVFWNDHLDQIKLDFEAVKMLGSAAAEEWLKGLELRGKRTLTDVSRWEKWDLSGGVRQMRMTSISPSPTPNEAAKTGPALPKPSESPTSNKSQHGQTQAEQQRQKLGHGGIPGLPTKARTPNLQLRTQVPSKRTKEEVIELKAKRRAEIERRALLLSPPLTPSVLAHIPSFQAALQIIAPLDDSAWELLKPRLLARREDAEIREKENVASARALQERIGESQKAATTSKAPKEVADKDWDEVQGPLRARISGYADEIIGEAWDDGEKVTKKTISRFAVDVLLYVRNRFYAEATKDAAAAVAAGMKPIVDPPEGPWTQKLTLENMKWLFDLKIKPHTEKHSKELFLCSACEGNFKNYGFEGVIQHYAAKHTVSLSLGSVVVHWRAEWPEHPPFSSEAKIPEVSPIVPHPGYQPSPVAGQPYAGYSGYQTGTLPQYAGPAYGAPVHYPGYAPYAPFATANAYGSNGLVNMGAPYGGAPSYGQEAASQYYQMPPSYAAQTHTTEHFAPYPSYTHPTPQYSHGSDASLQGPYGRHQTTKPSTSHLDFMAKIARDTWRKLSKVNGLPGLIKIGVLVHCIGKQFRDEFSQAVPLLLFHDGLSNNKEMRPIRKVNGLSCKTCLETKDGRNSSFSFPQLVMHFYNNHVKPLESQGLPPVDWLTNMVERPEKKMLRGLGKMLENKPAAYQLVTEALPWALEKDLPDFQMGHDPRAGLPAEPGSDGTALLEKQTARVSPRSNEYDAGWRESDNSQANGRVPGPVMPSYHQREGPIKLETVDRRAATTIQPYNTAPGDVPHLRPASAVYSRHETVTARPDDVSAPAYSKELHQQDHYPVQNTSRDGQARRPSLPREEPSPVYLGDTRLESPFDRKRHLRAETGLTTALTKPSEYQGFLSLLLGQGTSLQAFYKASSHTTAES
ncbi:hypothetical protein G7046_g3153 [Stylonectria norvegica]|nr:hypothetical protein G7046_g3153 [Stylonectria norvegica]